MKPKTKYIAVVQYQLNIEACDMESAEHIANQSIPTDFLYAMYRGRTEVVATKTGEGSFKSALVPLVMLKNGDICSH